MPYDTPPSISTRKQSHIDVCKTGSNQQIESRQYCGFESIKFIHHALPEISCDEISTETEFLEKKIRLPLFISCMTGGSEEGYRANKELAIAAQKIGIPIGLGSMRVLLTNPERIKDFLMRPFAPDVPIIGNIGAVQIRDESLEKIQALVKQQEVDALAIHLNCGQELFQKGGDRDFRGLKNAIAKAVEKLKIPIIVKETGFGINPSLVKELIAMGVAYVDVAGAGGTNWILVEQGCLENKDSIAEEFATWGNSTAVLLDACRDYKGKILASGGLRTGTDIAKSIALGAVAAGMALPFIRSAIDGGAEAVCKQISDYNIVLRNVMLLTGCKNISELQKIPLLKSSNLEHTVSSIKAIELHS